MPFNYYKHLRSSYLRKKLFYFGFTLNNRVKKNYEAQLNIRLLSFKELAVYEKSYLLFIFLPFRRIGYNYNASYFLFDDAWSLGEELHLKIII